MTNQPRPEICVLPDLAALCRAAAEAFVQLANAAVNQRGGFVIALCGGRTAPHFYRTLAETAYCPRIPWENVHVFWSDERYVSPESEHSNYGVTKRALLDHVTIPPNHIHPMPTLLPTPEEAAAAYEEELTMHFSGQTPRFDLMVMGLGEDGHTASLFPRTSSLFPLPSSLFPLPSSLNPDVQSRLVIPTLAPPKMPPRERLTMTFPVFNNAENVWFLVSGAAKAGALERAVTGPAEPWECPASGVRPTKGIVTWWVDDAAFRGL